MRVSGFLVIIVAGLLVAGASRLAYLEATEGPELRAEAQRQQTLTRKIPALRGEILDTCGRVLAGTVRRPSVYVDPALVRDARYAAHSVGPVLGLDVAELEELLRNPPRRHFVWLKRRLDDREVAAFESMVRARRLRAFGVQREPTRVYPHGRVAPHVLGFVGTDLCGLAGVEQAYDELLTGTPGELVSTVDVGRRRVRSRAAQRKPAVDGATVVLTIDAYIQQAAQEALARAVEKHRAQWGTAIVLDPQAGEVLALATIPDFDPAAAIPPSFNEMKEPQRAAVRTLWRNRAVSDSYEPGSVFKPFLASSALNEGLVGINDRFSINGPTRQFGSRTIHDSHAYGVLALHEVISKSSNIGMGLLGARCGNERLHRWVSRFGFGSVTGIGLPGEHAGLLNNLADWTSFSTQSIPIGQEIAVTPIQIVSAFSVFCNGGVLLQPRIVRGVIGPDGTPLADYSRPVPVRRVLDEEVAEMFRRRALVETVTSGTGKPAALAEYQVFGKTGTAQVARTDGRGYEPEQYVGSFIGGAPSDDPRVVVLVSIYRPSKDGYYGSVVAAPAVKEILAETLAYMQVPPELRDDGPRHHVGSRTAVAVRRGVGLGEP